MSHANTLVWEREKSSPSWLRSAILVVLSSFLISLFAKVTIPLPFTPIPIATQGIVILILSFFLGSKRAPAATLCFLAQGACGLPVFAGGLGGMAHLFGPSCGFLFGYLAASFLVGYLSDRMVSPTPLKLFWALAAGNAIFFLFGVPYLATFVGFKNALIMGLAPFLIGDLMKLVAGVKIIQWLGTKK